MIHSTLTDKDGNTYRIVSSWWMKALTVLCLLNFIILMLIVAGLIDNIHRVESTMNFSDKQIQRNAAIDEMIKNRGQIQQWVFEQVCDEMRAKGKYCLEGPKWWADPDKYPLLKDDPSGAGLFAPQ